MEEDFSGWASKNDIVCSDGRTIRDGAFKHYDKRTVPLVWKHQHNEPINVLGHAVIETRPEGTYTYGYFNDSEYGKHAKTLVQHGDIKYLSIYANELQHSPGTKDVIHGELREVSLVMAGANPGAYIENISLRHGDEWVEVDDEAVIYTGLDIEFEHPEDLSHESTDSGDSTITEGAAMADEVLEHADKTVQEVLDELTDEQRKVVDFLLADAAETAGNEVSSELAQSATENIVHNHYHLEGPDGMTNIFEDTKTDPKSVLSHDQLATIFADAEKLGSLGDSFLKHAGTYGVDDIDFLFPDARSLSNSPDVIGRRTEWVADVLSTTKHSPFSRIKSTAVDLTADEARAKGYVKGSLKKDEVIRLLRRVTTPTTVYKKQKLDRDDIVDITDLDVVAWLKAEMRVMLDEEIARAILVGDARESDDPDKIDEEKLRPIAYDNDMYATKVNFADSLSPSDQIEAILRSRKHYKGTGRPTLYTTDDALTDLILDKDTLGRRYYNTEAELASALRVEKIVVVEAMESNPDIFGIIVNLVDYTIGADKGGEISMFDDFDIDYNQQKYLIETRISGALTKPKSAIVLTRVPANTVTPAVPTFVASTGVLTIPTSTGAIYRHADTGVVYSSGAQTAIAPNATIEVEITPAAGYTFPHGFDNDFEFTRNAS